MRYIPANKIANLGKFESQRGQFASKIGQELTGIAKGVKHQSGEGMMDNLVRAYGANNKPKPALAPTASTSKQQSGKGLMDRLVDHAQENPVQAMFGAFVVGAGAQAASSR